MIIWASTRFLHQLSAQDRTPPHLKAANLGDLKLELLDDSLTLLDDGVYFRLEGRYQKKHFRLEDKETLIAGLPQGKYVMTLEGQDSEKIARHEISIDKQKTLKLQVAVFGPSHNPESKTWDFQVAEEGGKRSGLVQFYIPNPTYWSFANGTRRFHHSNQALEISAVHELRWYPDENDDLLDDRMDPRMPPPKPEHRKAMLLGQMQAPFVTGLETRVAGRTPVQWAPLQRCMPSLPEPGELLLIHPLISSAGGTPVQTVAIRILNSDHREQHLLASDDGSLLDLMPNMPGFQPSGDRMAQDGQFTLMLPMSVPMLGLLSDATLEISAVNQAGKASQTISCRMPAPSSPPVVQQVQAPELRIRMEGDTLVLQTAVSMQVHIVTDSKKKPLYPQKKTLNLFTYSDSFTTPVEGGLFLTAFGADGTLFYAGWPFVN